MWLSSGLRAIRWRIRRVVEVQSRGLIDKKKWNEACMHMSKQMLVSEGLAEADLRRSLSPVRPDHSTHCQALQLALPDTA
jgi:hypothetical protein